MTSMPNNLQVISTLKAQNDLKSIAIYHKLRVGPVSAKKITDKILNKLDMLTSFPDIGSSIPSAGISETGFRMLVIGEYLCFYSRQKDTIVVHHIVHGSTDYIKNLFL